MFFDRGRKTFPSTFMACHKRTNGQTSSYQEKRKKKLDTHTKSVFLRPFPGLIHLAPSPICREISCFNIHYDYLSLLILLFFKRPFRSKECRKECAARTHEAGLNGFIFIDRMLCMDTRKKNKSAV